MRYVFDVKGFPSVEDALNRIDALEDLLAGINVPRFVVGLSLVDGHLIITFSDGTTQDLGVVGGGVVATLDNTSGLSTLTLDSIAGLLSQVNAIDDQMVALGL